MFPAPDGTQLHDCNTPTSAKSEMYATLCTLQPYWAAHIYSLSFFLVYFPNWSTHSQSLFRASTRQICSIFLEVGWSPSNHLLQLQGQKARLFTYQLAVRECSVLPAVSTTARRNWQQTVMPSLSAPGRCVWVEMYPLICSRLQIFSWCSLSKFEYCTGIRFSKPLT
jgi:hypothetical protein